MTPNRSVFILALAATLAAPTFAPARDLGGDGGSQRGGGGSRSAPPPAARQPMVINMGHASSGGYGRNYPAQRPQQSQPSWGHVQRLPAAPPQRRNQAPASQAASAWHQGAGHWDASPYGRPGEHASQAVQHHPYTQGYVRQRLQKLGVRAEPAYITDRAEIVHTDRAHSSIALPTRGLAGTLLNAALLVPRAATMALLGGHMALVSGAAWSGRVQAMNRDEGRSGHYYWHHGEGFDYCHYRDDWGYHWYGWYLGDQCFWTRQFNGRWWWYDQSLDRWTFYNDGFFWWQDPYHVGELYCYNDGAYIPVNSADDQIVVTQPSDAVMKAVNSPDGSRTVKIVAGNSDAFLYDDSAQPAFNPVYLASGVESVEFSDSANGRPLEVILRLKDGSFDLFDGQGRPYGPSQQPQDDGGPGADVVPQAAH